MLYIYVIQKRACPPEVYRDYFAAASRCQSNLFDMAEKGSLSERYCLVLEELRVETVRQMECTGSSTATTSVRAAPYNLPPQENQQYQPTSAPSNTNPAGTADYIELMEDAAMDFQDNPGSVGSDHSGWGQFASMVSSGLGNLDTFFNDDPFRA